MSYKNLIVIGIFGSVKDWEPNPERGGRWRPTVSIFQHPEMPVARLELLCEQKHAGQADALLSEIRGLAPSSRLRAHPLRFKDPWDFEEVYSVLHEFARNYPFDPESEDYLVHITTGTHVQRICLFLLTESRHFPGRLLQTWPPGSRGGSDQPGYTIIDLDLSRYDALASRFGQERRDDLSFLKSGIETRNAQFNRTIEQIEKVAIRSSAPLLLTGPTGAGKSRLARRIYELKKARRQIGGAFVEVNCATLRGDAAMSALFGHVKGAFTGALRDRPGLLRAADSGMLFLDEIGELGPDEQAMLLRALEEKSFLPLGADQEVQSSFQLICGSNRDLKAAVAEGGFREDLLSRINLWTYRLPGLKDRCEDIEPNLGYELDQYAAVTGSRVTFNKEARERFLAFACSPRAAWTGNFRDLNGAVVRMATLAPGGRITVEVVEEEIGRLESSWAQADQAGPAREEILEQVMGPDRAGRLDLFDRVQLARVLEVCRRSQSLSEAGRALFAVSRQGKTSTNDSDRLRKYLARFGLTLEAVRQAAPQA